MSTRKEVAKLAGVSVATVSYVLNNTKNVTPKVRQRVLDAAEELQYSPNLVAKSLATKQTRHVAMLVDNLKNPYYCEVLEGVQEAAARNGYIVSVVLVDVARRKSILDLAARGVDGIILAVGTHDVREYLGEKIPVAFVGKQVDLDFENAVWQMVRFLKGKGHRKIAFISGMPVSDPGHQRYICLVRALELEKIPLYRELIVDGVPYGKTDEMEGMRAVKELLKRGNEFTAVFAVNDLMALGVCRGLRDAGYSVPGDISVVGCDAIGLLDMISPALSTIDTHAYETGQALMESLIEEMQGTEKAEGEVRTITAHFLDKESIGDVSSGKKVLQI